MKFLNSVLRIALVIQPTLLVGTAWAQTSPQALATPSAVTPQGAPNSFSPLSASTLDSILVSIGDEVILLSELQKIVKVASNGQTLLKSDGRLVGGSISPQDTNQLLDQIISQRVLTQKVKEMSLNAGEDELDVEIQNFLKNQNITPEKFQQILKDEGETPESHREEFRQQLETQRFIGRVIRPLVTVNEDEVKNFYLQQAGAATRSQKIVLRSLVIEMPAQQSEPQRQAKQLRIETVKKEVEAGADFTSLVKLYSESPDALKTEGILPPRNAKDLPVEIKDKLKDLKPNAVVGPVTLGSSVFFFQYVGSQLDDLGEFAKQKTQWENKLLEVKFKERLDEYVKAERSKSKIVRRDVTFIR